MVKRIIWEPSRSLKEFVLLPGYTGNDCTIDKISLETRLAKNLVLDIPFLSAAMMSVTGHSLALELAQNGGLGVIPDGFQIKDQVSIIKRIKNFEAGFINNPLTAKPAESIASVLEKINKFGYSTMFIVDDYRAFLGVFDENNYDKTIDVREPVEKAMIPFDKKNGKEISWYDSKLSLKEIKKSFEKNSCKFAVLLDGQGRLVNASFKKDFKELKVAASINTYEGWAERAKACVEAGADLITIDTSDAFNYFALKVIKEFKASYPEVPVCFGNIVTEEAFYKGVEAGADMVKVGMGIGSICSTTDIKALGRGQFSAGLEVCSARDNAFKENGNYVPVILDGGISNARDMVIALTLVDAIMLGNYFNKFFEAAGQALNRDKKPTSTEEETAFKETWGEGSRKAQNYRRYGHRSVKTAFEEGVEGTVEYKGRLKPNLERDILKIKSALSNAGCKNLKEFREKAVLEVISPLSQADAGFHDLASYKT